MKNKKIKTLKIDVNQLNRILDVTGFPSRKLLDQVNEDARNYLEKNQRKPERVNFAEYFHEIDNPYGNNKIQKFLYFFFILFKKRK